MLKNFGISGCDLLIVQMEVAFGNLFLQNDWNIIGNYMVSVFVIFINYI